mgnify:FL=1
MEEFKKLLGAKKKIDPIEKEAKLSAIKGMKKMAGDMMTDEIKGMQKVTVAAPDKAGLEMGLEKAEDVVSDLPESLDEEVVEDEDSSEDKIEDALEAVETPEEIDLLMQRLAEKKAALKME